MQIGQHLLIEAGVLLAVLVALTLLHRRGHSLESPIYWRFTYWLSSLTTTPRRAYGALATYTLGLLVLLSLIAWPYPTTHDEFSYRLAADTFAHGWLGSPTHRLWPFFETFDVIHEPFYGSKYPPGQGFVMAMGQVLLGSPVFGIWLSYIAAVLAVYWLLTLFLPPVPALLGGWLTATHAGIVLNWGVAYWGGAVPMLGGALTLVAAIQLRQQPVARWVAVMAGGCVLLWLSRPYEGLAFSLAPLAVLLMVAQRVLSWDEGWRHLVRWAPALLLLVLAVSALPAYNYRLTGNPVRAPYSYYYTRYEQARPFLFQPMGRKPHFVRTEMKKLHMRESGRYKFRKTIPGFAVGLVQKTKLYGAFFIGILFLMPLLLFLQAPKGSDERLMFWAAVLPAVATTLCTYEAPHYLAPAVGALAVMIGLGLWSLWNATDDEVLEWDSVQQRTLGRLVGGQWRLWAQRLVLAICISTVLVLCIEATLAAMQPGRQMVRQRAQHERTLVQQGGQHVILVQYAPTHNLQQEWIYNLSDIDAQPVIWAHHKGPDRNQLLMRYYPTRTFWLLKADEAPTHLTRLPTARRHYVQRPAPAQLPAQPAVHKPVISSFHAPPATSHAPPTRLGLQP